MFIDYSFYPEAHSHTEIHRHIIESDNSIIVGSRKSNIAYLSTSHAIMY